MNLYYVSCALTVCSLAILVSGEPLQDADCYEYTPPKVLASFCMDGGNPTETVPLPPDSIVISGQFDNTVQYNITQQLIENAGLAIKHGGDTGLESTCDVYEDVKLGSSYNLESQCLRGVTKATVVVYMEENFNTAQCTACNVESLDDMGGKFCAYIIEIPCKTTSVECGNPSGSPTASPTSDPTGSPTQTPTSAPTASPTSTPTGSPTQTPTSAPTSTPLVPYPLPKDNAGKTLVLQTGWRNRVRVAGFVGGKVKRCVLNIRVRKQGGRIHGGPNENLVLHFSTSDGVPTGEKFDIDGIRHWYLRSTAFLVYPSAPYNTVENCEQARNKLATLIKFKYYIDITYPEGYEEENEVRKLNSNEQALEPVRGRRQ